MTKNTHHNNLHNHVCAIFITFMCPLATQALDQQPQIKQKESISIEISYGELIDKITILEIKAAHIKNKNKLHNVQTELLILNNIYYHEISLSEEIKSLKKELKGVNERLWAIEDDIRLKEQNKEFDEKFIQLARLVYITNDRRGNIKREINEHLGSYLVEEKEYTEYEA